MTGWQTEEHEASSTVIYDAPDTETTGASGAVLFEPPASADERPRREPPASSPAPAASAGARLRAAGQRVAGTVRADPLRAVLFTVPVVVFLVGAWVHRFITEDGYINFHIVQQLAAGNGPNFNPGERVEAFTSPLFIVVLTVARAALGWAMPLENLAVIIGLVFSTLALVFAMLASTRLIAIVGPLTGERPTDDGGPGGPERSGQTAPLLIPIGALVFACTPPMWRWATSGLETSLSFIWISLCFWGSVRRYADSRHHDGPLLAPDRPRWLLLVIGLGPLVRPEYLVYSACFLGAVWMTSRPGWRARLRSALWAVALVAVYQVFRMGYYASLIPNTALAKNSDASQWGRGAKYAQDFLSREWLWIALAGVIVLLALVVARAVRADRRAAALALAPVVGAALNVLYVQRVGGDYMYARWYVPAWVAMLAPVAVVSLPRPRRGLRLTASLGVAGAAVVVLVLWSAGAVINGKILDANTGLGFGDYGMLLPGETNPVNPRDYGFAYASIEDLFRRWGAGDNVLWDGTDQSHPVIPLRPGQGIVVKSGAVGASSFVAGPDIWIVDDRGLADVVGARLENNEALPIPGHEKLLSWDYVVARWAPPRADDSETVRSARRAFSCGRMKDLARATTEPMSVGLFVENIVNVRRYTALRIPADAAEFEAKFCGT